ncbi:Tgt2/MlaC family protein [Anaplasma capra]|uniref:Tgt2/MlaC family protein n=1 Tax=Anaplasma capra TaxID=1562740 RepID=UPI0021D5BF54|nr:ABC transporter substrate-binding protein [Anaplasma capra]MCU7611306.1 ABC transporter substrate-binding protein [Anaplasma capra]MCU7612741.1 ABC transporter substrate-binding protein [Anaplasma capra]
MYERRAMIVRVVAMCVAYASLVGATARFDTCSNHPEVCGFIETLKSRVYSIVSGDEDVDALLEEVVSGVLDLNGIAKFTMGGHWKIADSSQRERFVGTYGRYIKGVYIRQLRKHAFHLMRIMSVRSVGDNAYAVRVRLAKRGHGDDFIVIEFHVVDDGKLGICDMKINNFISTAITQRSIVDDIIKKRGIDGAISHFELENEKAPMNSIGGLRPRSGRATH